MRKLLVFTILCSLLISCEVNDNSRSGNVSRKFIDEFVVRDEHWSLVSGQDGLNPFLQHVRTFPALDRNVVNNGVVLGYIERNGMHYPLQTTSWLEDGVNYPWEESISFGYRENELVLFFKDSEFYYNDPLLPMKFKFVLIW